MRQKSRDAAKPSRAPIASSGEVLHGRAFSGASSAARPAAERDTEAISGFPAYDDAGQSHAGALVEPLLRDVDTERRDRHH